MSNELFDEILSQKCQGICSQCGHHRTHRAIYCPYCGTKYITDITLLQGMKIYSAIPQNMVTSATYKISYISAVYELKVKKAGYSIKNFEKYVTEKVKNFKESNND